MICCALSIPYKILSDAYSKKPTPEFREASKVNAYSVEPPKLLIVEAYPSDTIWIGKFAFFNKPGGRLLPFLSLNYSISIKTSI